MPHPSSASEPLPRPWPPWPFRYPPTGRCASNAEPPPPAGASGVFGRSSGNLPNREDSARTDFEFRGALLSNSPSAAWSHSLARGLPDDGQGFLYDLLSELFPLTRLHHDLGFQGVGPK